MVMATKRAINAGILSQLKLSRMGAVGPPAMSVSSTDNPDKKREEGSSTRSDHANAPGDEDAPAIGPSRTLNGSDDAKEDGRSNKEKRDGDGEGEKGGSGGEQNAEHPESGVGGDTTSGAEVEKEEEKEGDMVTEPQVENDKTGRTDAEPAQTEQAQAQGGSVEEEQSEAEADDSDSDPASLDELEWQLRKAYKPVHEIIGRGVVNAPGGYRDIYECVMTYQSRANRSKKRKRTSSTGARVKVDHTVLNKVEHAIWIIATSEKIDESSASPASTFESCPYDAEPVPGLSFPPTSNWDFDMNDRVFFDALAMHVRPVVMYRSSASPGMAVALRADCIEAFGLGETDDETDMDRLVDVLLERFTIATQAKPIQDQLQVVYVEESGQSDDESPESEKSDGTRESREEGDEDGEEAKDHDEDGDADEEDDEKSNQHKLILWKTEYCDQAKKRRRNFNLWGRAMLKISGQWQIWYAREDKDGAKEWVAENALNCNIAEGFKYWSLHRVGLDPPEYTMACDITTAYLKVNDILFPAPRASFSSSRPATASTSTSAAPRGSRNRNDDAAAAADEDDAEVRDQKADSHASKCREWTLLLHRLVHAQRDDGSDKTCALILRAEAEEEERKNRRSLISLRVKSGLGEDGSDSSDSDSEDDDDDDEDDDE